MSDTADRAERRAPYGTNSEVGEVGRRTRERILDAAKAVLADVPFHDLRLDDVADRAGCSRTSLYQYFSGKEHLLLVLSARVTRDLEAATPRLEGLAPTAAGRDALAAWITDLGEVYARHASVFQAWTAVTSATEDVHGRAQSVMAAYAATLGARIARAGAVTHDATIAALLAVGTVLQCWGRYHRNETDIDAAALTDAMVDVLHRSLFGAAGTRGAA